MINKKVAVVGCGGLGSFVIDLLVRKGIKNLVVVDNGVVDWEDFNRNLLYVEEAYQEKKSEQAKKRILKIDPSVKVHAYDAPIDKMSAEEILEDVDIVVDSLPEVADKIRLEEICSSRGIPVLSGSVFGWEAIIMLSKQGKHHEFKFYNANEPVGSRSVLGCTDAMAASCICKEVLDFLEGKPMKIEDKVLKIDSKTGKYEYFDIDEKIIEKKPIHVTVQTIAGTYEYDLMDGDPFKKVAVDFMGREAYFTVNGIFVSDEDYADAPLEDQSLIVVKRGVSPK